ncbi:MAG TPA: type II TA system antitoxin MqsA family protein [Kofleriaceae bacterium]|nr:type II TA system antitoxin MqsA family protein [Kofleriaceae bacterium]
MSRHACRPGRALMKCPQCRHEMVRSTENHRYTESGLSNVVLVGVEVRHCSHCGEHTVSIPHIEDLHRSIAMAIIKNPGRLAPSEIRFLRKWLGWSGVDFAKHMGVTPETVSRWESAESAKPMGGTAERLLRLAVAYGQPVDAYSIGMLTEINDDPASSPPLLAMKPGRAGWAPTTLAA